MTTTGVHEQNCMDQPFQVLIETPPVSESHGSQDILAQKQASDSEGDLSDIDSLLDAASEALSNRRKAIAIAPEDHKSVAKPVIQTENGVAKLNSDVFIAQTEKQALAQAAEKVCCISYREKVVQDDMMRNICV